MASVAIELPRFLATVHDRPEKGAMSTGSNEGEDMKNSKAIVGPLTLLIAMLAAGQASADAADARIRGTAWLLKQQRGDGAWTSRDGVSLPLQATSSAVIALKTGGLGKSASYAAALSYVGNADVDSVDSMARKAATLGFAGLKGSAQSEVDRLFSLRGLSTAAIWSSYGGSDIDVVDTALGLRALRMADATYVSKGTLIAGGLCAMAPWLIDLPSGRAALPITVPGLIVPAPTAGKPSVLASAVMLYEIEYIRRSSLGDTLGCSSGTRSLADLASRLTNWIQDQQNSDGGFGEQRHDGSHGDSSVLVTALVYRTLSDLAVVRQPTTANALAWLVSRQDPSGSWSADPLVTAQVLWALPAPTGAVADGDRDGIPDVVETALGSNPGGADSRSLITSPTLAGSTPNAPRVFSGAMVNAYYALGPTSVAQGFKPGVTPRPPFRVSGGSLPPGMSLDANSGQIVGTPTVSGSYVFQLTDSVGNTSWERIDVAEAATASHAVPLPGWTQALLAMFLAFALWYQRRQLKRSA